MASDHSSLNKIDTLEELQLEKKRLARKVELARDALVHRTNPAPWIEAAKMAAGGLILAGFLAYGIKKSLSGSGNKEAKAATSFQATPSSKSHSEKKPLNKAAVLTFLLPFLRQGVGFLLDELENRVEKGGR